MRWFFLTALLAFTACPQEPKPDAGVPYQHCLDTSAEATRAPGSELPCELLPPGFKR